MKQSGYQRLKSENTELKEKLALYENGTINVEIDEHVVRVPKSFQIFYNEWSRSEYVRNRKEKLIEDMLVEEILDYMPRVKVRFVMGDRAESVELGVPEWEFMLKHGDNDPSKGLDTMLKMAEKAKS